MKTGFWTVEMPPQYGLRGASEGIARNAAAVVRCRNDLAYRRANAVLARAG
jgi:hypothetical protein